MVDPGFMRAFRPTSWVGRHDKGCGNQDATSRRQPLIRDRRGRTRIRLGVAALVGLVVCAMAASVALYVNGAASQRIPAHSEATSGGTTVTLDAVSISNNYRQLVGDLIIKPGPALVDPATDSLKQDLTVAVTSATTPVRRTYSRGMLPGVFPVPLTLAHDVERWPFDSYDTGPIMVEVFAGP